MPISMPPKIDPNLNPNNIDLTVLNELKAYIENNKALLGESIAKDALKVVNNVRFIKVNEAFITYAVKNSEEDAIYRGNGHQGHDKSSRTLRDLDGTSFHFINYNPDQAEEYFAILMFEIENLENDYHRMKEKNRLIGYCHAFRWEESIGCLHVRLESPKKYAELEIEILTKLIDQACATIYPSLDDRDNYQLLANALFQYVEDRKLFGTIVKESEEATRELALTRVMFAKAVEKYIKNVFFEEINIPIDIYLPQKKSITWEEVSDIISRGNACAKVVRYSSTLPTYTTSIKFIVDQLKDPQHDRPVRKLKKNTDRNNPFDPSTQTTRNRTVAPVRGAPKDTPFPKKTPHSPLPANNFGNLYAHGDQDIFFLFDLIYGHLKFERYTSTKNMGSDYLKKRMWHGTPLSAGIAGIRLFHERMASNGMIPRHAESVHSSPRQALIAMGATCDTELARINLLMAAHYVKCELFPNDEMVFPLIFSPKDLPKRNYPLDEQLKDLIAFGKKYLSSDNYEMLFAYYQNHFSDSNLYLFTMVMIDSLQKNTVLSDVFFNVMKQFDKLDFSQLNQHSRQLLLTFIRKADMLDDDMRRLMINQLVQTMDKYNCHLQQDGNNQLLLHDALEINCQEMVLFLAENFPETLLQRNSKNQTILHAAARLKDTTLLKYFTKKMPSLINEKDDSGETPLFVATRSDQLEACEFLLQQGASFSTENIFEQNVLYVACETDAEIARLYMRHGLRLDSKNSSGDAPIDHIEKGRENASHRIKIHYENQNSADKQWQEAVFALKMFMGVSLFVSFFIPAELNAVSDDIPLVSDPLFYFSILAILNIAKIYFMADQPNSDSKLSSIGFNLLPYYQYVVDVNNQILHCLEGDSQTPIQEEDEPLLINDNALPTEQELHTYDLDIEAQLSEPTTATSQAPTNESVDSTTNRQYFPFNFGLLTSADWTTITDQSTVEEEFIGNLVGGGYRR